MTVVVETRAKVAPFAILQGNAVAARQPLKMVDLQVAAEADARATQILRKAAEPFGSGAATPVTRFLEGGGIWALTVVASAAAAIPAARAVMPHDSWAAVGTLAAFAAGCVACCGLYAIVGRSRAKASQKTLEADRLEALVKLHADAAEQPLVRCVIGRVAEEHRLGWKSRSVFVSRQAAKVIEGVAASAATSEDLARQRKLIRAVRCLETTTRPTGVDVEAVIEAFAAMTREEQADLASDLLARLFDGAAPRNTKVPFTAGQALHTTLCEVAEQAHEQDRY